MLSEAKHLHEMAAIYQEMLHFVQHDNAVTIQSRRFWIVTSMRLHIEHETIFSYSQPVREAIGEARLRPRNDAGQRLLGFRLALDPHVPVDPVSDRFGNTIHCYSVLPPHRRLTVTAISEVDTSADALSYAPALTPLEQHSFTAPSPYVPITND